MAGDRDVVLAKTLWERTQKMAILKQLHTHFKVKREKRCGNAVPTPLHSCR